jgi:cbb3-type cytochrome c oxidase subunit III
MILTSTKKLLPASFLVVALAVTIRAGLAQEQGKDDPTVSTTTGVYLETQAKAGQEIFEATCLGGCHNMASHRGAAFKQHWNGKPLWELFKLINEEMPKDDAGSLSVTDTANLVAYILKLNGQPTGKDELSTEPAALKKIKIDLPQ